MGRFNFGNQPNIGGGGENNYSANSSEGAVRTEEYYADSPDVREEYALTLKDLWLCIGFCIVGWIVACVGFSMIADSDLGVLLVILGVLIVDLPCFRILLAGGSLGMLFGSVIGAERIIHYSDGTKERDNSAWSAGLAATLFTWLITLVVGVFAMVFRIFKNFMHLLSLKKEGDIKTDVKTAPWLPIVVGLAVFFGGLIVVGIVGAANEYQASVRDDFTDEETTAMLEGISKDMTEQNWSFKIWQGAEIALTVDHKYYPGEGSEIDITVTKDGEERLGIPEGAYAIGVFTDEDEILYATVGQDGNISGYVTDTALCEKLYKFTPEGIFAIDAMLQDIEKVNAYDNESNQGGMYDVTEYKITYKVAGANGYEQEMYAGEKNGVWKVRIVDSPFGWSVSEYLEFKYN